MTGSKARTAEHGFTLIELLVSLLLMGLVLAGLGAGLSTIAKGWDRHGDRLANQDMLLRARTQLHRDIAGLERVPWPEREHSTPEPSNGAEDAENASAGKKPRFIFKGGRDGVQFIVIEPPYPTRTGPYVLSYAASNGRVGRLMRSRVRYHPDMRDLTGLVFKDKVRLIEGPYRFEFSYGYRLPAADGISGAWRWFPAWPHEDRLPTLIKLEIRDGANGAHVMAPIIARPRIDAEQACARRKKASAGCTVELAATGSGQTSTDQQETEARARNESQ